MSERVVECCLDGKPCCCGDWPWCACRHKRPTLMELGGEKFQPAEGWKVYGPSWSKEYGWTWAARSPGGMWMGGTQMFLRSQAERAIRKHVPKI